VWFKYVASRDIKIEDALKKAVKNSLLDLYKVVGDEEKTTPIAIFKLSVELDNNQLCFKPSTEYLIQMVRATMASMTEILKDFKRMELIMILERRAKLEEIRIIKEKESKANSLLALLQQKKTEQQVPFDDNYKGAEDYFEQISSDHDIKKYTNKILENLKKWCDNLDRGELTDPWKK